MYSCSSRSLYKNTKFVLKLGASILLLGLASLLFHNRNSDFSPVSDTQFPENPQISASPVNYQEHRDQIPEKGQTYLLVFSVLSKENDMVLYNYVFLQKMEQSL